MTEEEIWNRDSQRRKRKSPRPGTSRVNVREDPTRVGQGIQIYGRHTSIEIMTAEDIYSLSV